MAGLLDAILGGGDQTPDAQGLTPSDNAQVGFGGIANLGAILMAAGQPMRGDERARILSQLGSVPATMQQQRQQVLGNKLGTAKLAGEQRANAAAAEMAKQAADPTLTQGMTPQMAALIKAAYQTGNPVAALAAMKENREANQPIPGAGGNVMLKQADGGWLITNPTTGIDFRTDASGNRVGEATGPGTGPAFDARVQRISNGDEAFPKPRDPLRARILSMIPPDVREQDYSAKQQAIKAITPGGKDFEGIMRPSQAYLEHAANLANTTDMLVQRGIISDGWADRNGGNSVRLLAPSVYSKEDQALITKWDELKGRVAGEANKFARGNGTLTDQAQREGSGLKDATSPAAIKGRLGALNDIMHGQLQTVAGAYQSALKKPSLQGPDLLQPGARQAYDKVQGWISGSSSAQGSRPTPTAEDIAYLKANPGARAKFEARFGPAPE